MFFQRKKRTLAKLESSFGEVKSEGFNLDLIKTYHQNKNNSKAFQVLSDQTVNDLDFDLFFCFADRTYSKIGQQYLYNQLRTIDYSSLKCEHQERVLKYLNENKSDRLKIQYQLQKLSQSQSYYVVDLFQKKIEPKSKWYFIIPILSAASALSIALSFISSSYILILLGLIPINVIIHYGLKRKTNLFLNSIPSLLAMGSVAKHLAKHTILKANNSEIDDSINTIVSIRRKMSIFKLEQKVDSDMEAAYWFLLEFIKIIFLLEPLLLFNSLDKLRVKSKEIEEVFRFIGEVDSIVSVSSMREGLDYFCIPEINTENSDIRFQNSKHPLIINCIPNSLETSKSILLTGSNMSGKTTFIRSIGLNYIAGITLNTCFASSAHLPIARLYSVIRIEDDIMASSSYFYKEVDEIKKIIDETKKPTNSIVLLDELFKGTNTIERIASAKAVLSHLENGKNQIFVSTHDIELTALLKEQFDLFHFSESISNSIIYFDFKLKTGIPSNGNAIRILEINGYPQEIVKEARSLVAVMKTP
jgi:hypothetical protein